MLKHEAFPEAELPVADTRAKVYRELPCKLLGVEVEERGVHLAQLEGELIQQELEKKEDAATYNGRIKILRGQIAHTAKQVREGQELRQVEVRELIVPSTGMVATQRADTGEVLSQRAMTEAERQRGLFGRGLADVSVPAPVDPVGSVSEPMLGDPNRATPTATEADAAGRDRRYPEDDPPIGDPPVVIADSEQDLGKPVGGPLEPGFIPDAMPGEESPVEGGPGSMPLPDDPA